MVMQTKPHLKEAERTKEKKNKLSRRTVVAAVLIILVIPAAILLGLQWSDSIKFALFGKTVVVRQYYFTSLFIIICTMLPFFMVFEKRKPQARELVVLSVLIALAVAGRAAFFMLPQFKPVVALVIVAGVCFGAESGFLVGAVSGFISNFFFGQGPWTPWQMFCFGIIGFLAGILFKKGVLKKSRVALCIFGGLSTYLIYGTIMDVSSAMMASSAFSWEAVCAYLLSGLPFNLIHSVATIFFLFVLSQPMIEKLDRIKKKIRVIGTINKR